MKTKVREANAKLKDGLPRSSYAYAPTVDPATWKLPFRTATGAPDPERLPTSAAAVAEGDLPADMVPMVKSKLRQAYRKWKGSDAEYPEGIKEVEAGLEMSVVREAEASLDIGIREATILLDRGSVSAQVVASPNGDFIVIPNWTGAFADLAKAYKAPTPAGDNWSSSYDAQDAADIVSKLVRLKKGEVDEPEQNALIDTAIGALLKFIPAEAAEMSAEANDTCAMCDHATDCACTVCPCIAHAADVSESGAAARVVGALIREAGRRNNSKDQKMVQSIHDMSHTLGAEHDTETRANYKESQVDIDPAGAAVNVTFRESGLEYVTLAEAAPVFDDATKTVTITPIKPGFGNKKDGFYYPAHALREATDSGMFSGLKMFRNHPRKSDEKDLPERSVTDWFAVTKESSWDEASQAPRVKVQVFDDSDWSRFKAAPEHVAFSVLGGGSVRPGKVGGKDARIIESLTSLRSVDWVTNAGAGGAIQFAESASEEFEMDLKDMTVEQVTALKESNPEVYKHLVGLAAAMTPEGAPKGDPTDPKPEPEPTPTPPEPAPAPEPAVPAAEPVKESEAAAVKESSPVDISEADIRQLYTELKTEREARKATEDRVAATAAAQGIVKAVLKETTLPAVATSAIEEKFAEAAMGNGYIYSDEKGLRAALDREVKSTEKLLSSVGRYTPRVSAGVAAPEPGTEKATVRESVEARIAKKWGKEVIPTPDPTVIWAGKAVDEEGPQAEVAPKVAAVSEASKPVESRLSQKWGSGN